MKYLMSCLLASSMCLATEVNQGLPLTPAAQTLFAGNATEISDRATRINGYLTTLCNTQGINYVQFLEGCGANGRKEGREVSPTHRAKVLLKLIEQTHNSASMNDSVRDEAIAFLQLYSKALRGPTVKHPHIIWQLLGTKSTIDYSKSLRGVFEFSSKQVPLKDQVLVITYLKECHGHLIKFPEEPSGNLATLGSYAHRIGQILAAHGDQGGQENLPAFEMTPPAAEASAPGQSNSLATEDGHPIRYTGSQAQMSQTATSFGSFLDELFVGRKTELDTLLRFLDTLEIREQQGTTETYKSYRLGGKNIGLNPIAQQLTDNVRSSLSFLKSFLSSQDLSSLMEVDLGEGTNHRQMWLDRGKTEKINNYLNEFYRHLNRSVNGNTFDYLAMYYYLEKVRANLLEDETTLIRTTDPTPFQAAPFKELSIQANETFLKTMDAELLALYAKIPNLLSTDMFLDKEIGKKNFSSPHDGYAALHSFSDHTGLLPKILLESKLFDLTPELRSFLTTYALLGPSQRLKIKTSVANQEIWKQLLEHLYGPLTDEEVKFMSDGTPWTIHGNMRTEFSSPFHLDPLYLTSHNLGVVELERKLNKHREQG